ncbi:hypothetical protein GUJ93_ZPchr0016g2497 [Zizania palustris]|uniref:Disease resistance R13L4/SHOC-2-like LRR domain-containing protein n=1 Tax=Zizania palustris TaxID=103762 RepID=A0A8J5TM50_ZIZPA|nr:hypothetical protein GUJ93_ZPchr0016g2497 [Zizania palustris]
MDIGKLLQLRKLGVVFNGNQNSFKHLLQAIEKLNRSLISLSIRVQVSDGHETPDMNMAEPTAFSFPKFLESLNICGVKSGLPRWIKELNRLSKLTLCETHLGEQDMAVVGNLKGLQYLQLKHRSYVQTKLTLGEKQFQHLKILLIHGPDITDISFNKTPKLEKMVWSFREMKSISGMDRLPCLRALEQLSFTVTATQTRWKKLLKITPIIQISSTMVTVKAKKKLEARMMMMPQPPTQPQLPNYIQSITRSIH